MTLPAENLSHPSLEVRLLGGFDVRIDDHPLPPLRSRREQWLLALLVLRHDRDTGREWLATTLWPDNDEPQALFYLRKSLSNLRQALGTAAPCLLAPTPRTLRLDLTNAWVDVVTFDTSLSGSAPSVDALEAAVALYRGPLLPECLEEWALVERNQREQAYLAALAALAAQPDPPTAVRWLRLLLTADPYRESAACALMQALADCGDPAAVTVVYQELRARLRQDLNAAPSPQTEALYRQLSQREKLTGAVLPPAPEAPPTRRHLPVPLSDLIGREEEIGELLDWLKRRRLVTLVGTGGIGKTRLAIAVAEAALPRFEGGVWFVDLAPLSDPALLAQAVARTLGIAEQPGRVPMETLVEALSSRSLLVVVDNCEHLREACAEVAHTLLSACPTLSIVATSRQALDVMGEQVYRVPSLPVPPLEAFSHEGEKDPHFLLEYEAVRLFVDRAVRVQSGFRLDRRSGAAVVEICRQLDGIPLAIEMAAARLRSLSVGEIRIRLADRFRLLTSGNRGVRPRQQTLRALVDWSYDLLREEEQSLLQRLAVFSGGWTLAAAESVCAALSSVREGGKEGKREGESSVLFPSFPIPYSLDVLASLVDKSLVLRREGGEEAGDRYGMLETIRQYGLERLEASGECDEIRRRHRDYFLRLAEEIKPKLSGPEQMHGYSVLEQEHDNMRTALTLCLESADPESGKIGLKLGAAMWPFWMNRGHMNEGREHLTALLAHPRAPVRSEAGADALNAAAALANQQSDYDQAHTLHTQSLEISRELGYRYGIASACNGLGNVSIDRNDYAAARVFYEESRATHRALGNRLGETVALANLGRVAFMQGDFASARVVHEQGLANHREMGNKQGIANGLYNIAMVSFCLDDYGACRTYGEECLAIRREMENRLGIAEVLNILGILYNHIGDYATARSVHEEGLAIHRELGNQWGIAAALLNLGGVFHSLEDNTAARALFEESLRRFRELGDRRAIADVLEALASTSRQEQAGGYSSRLWGAASALREALDLSVSAARSEKLEREMAAMRESMGEEAFATAWKEGHAMTTEQAIRYALSEEAA